MATADRPLPASIAACAALSFATLLGASAASAQDLASAEALFREGRALMDRGDLAAACPKLAESNRLDPSSGTALNLALCHAKQGKTASAWATYLVAARLAKQQNRPERVEEATSKARELEPDLSTLTIVVAHPVAGIEVLRGDQRVEAGSFGTRLPVDPGEHRVTARAVGHETLELSVVVGPERDAKTIEIPALVPVDAAAPGPSPATAPPDEPTVSGSSLAPWVLGGAGVVVLGAGLVFGGLALGAHGDADEACPTRTGCTGDALSARDRAETFANLSNVGVAVGGAAIAVAAVWLLVGGGEPDRDPGTAARPGLAIVPLGTTDLAGLSIRAVTR